MPPQCFLVPPLPHLTRDAGHTQVRLAWHDSGTYDCTVGSWPSCGGANGSIRFAAELGHGANAGLAKGINVYLQPIKKRHPAVSWADLIQMGSALAVRQAGGPRIPMRYGRIDTASEAQCPAAGNLPDAMAPFGDGSPDAATHLRRVFYRMGLNDEAIVALSGAHTLGRAWKERSGTVPHGVTNPTVYTAKDAVCRADGKPGVGLPGGQSWTKNWLTFDNSYFKPTGGDAALLRLPTDSVLATDPGFKPFYLKFGASQPAFFESYAKAHKQLSELGSAFMPAEGFVLDD